MADQYKEGVYEQMVRNSERVINESIQFHKKHYKGFQTDNISDGNHTMGELYKHRITLYIALCKMVHYQDGFVWKSKKNSDGESDNGWFLLGVNSDPGTQITYHLPECEWSKCDFALEIDQAPSWDGHNSDDVLGRIATLL